MGAPRHGQGWGHVVKCFVLQMFSKYKQMKYLCIIFRTCQLLGAKPPESPGLRWGLPSFGPHHFQPPGKNLGGAHERI